MTVRSTIFTLMCVLALSVTAQPSLIVSLSSTLLDQVLMELNPILDVIVTELVIPGPQTPFFALDNFSLYTFQIGTLGVAFDAQSTASPSHVTLLMNNISLTIPPTPYQISLKNHTCTGTISAVMNATNFNIGLDLAANETTGFLSIGNATTSLAWGDLAVSHTLEQYWCRVIQDAIRELEGSIDKLLAGAIEKALPSALQSKVVPMLDGLQNKLKIQLTRQPWVDGDFLSLSLDLAAVSSKSTHQVKSRLIPAGPPGKMPALPDRGFAVSFDATSINALIEAAAEEGKMDIDSTLSDTTSVLQVFLPGAYTLCPNCPLNVQMNLGESGTAVLTSFRNDTVTLSLLNANVQLNAVNGTKADLKNASFNVSSHTLPMVLFNINATVALENLHITNDTIWYTLAIPELTLGIANSQVGPLSGPELTEVIDMLVNSLVLPKYNKDFKGVKLKLNKDGLGVVHATAVVRQGYLIFAGDLELPNIG